MTSEYIFEEEVLTLESIKPYYGRKVFRKVKITVKLLRNASINERYEKNTVKVSVNGENHKEEVEYTFKETQSFSWHRAKLYSGIITKNIGYPDEGWENLVFECSVFQAYRTFDQDPKSPNKVDVLGKFQIIFHKPNLLYISEHNRNEYRLSEVSSKDYIVRRSK